MVKCMITALISHGITRCHAKVFQNRCVETSCESKHRGGGGQSCAREASNKCVGQAVKSLPCDRAAVCVRPS